MPPCKITKCSRGHWLDEERQCSTHRVRWHLPWSGERETRAWKGPRPEPTLCPVEQARQLAEVVDEHTERGYDRDLCT